MSILERGCFMVTRNDVAKRAGVSTAVVSNVINNKGYISEKTRMAVLSAIQELDYRPNYIARSLKTKKSSQLVIIVNEIRNEFFAEIAYAMEEYAYSLGYTTLIANGRDDEEFVRHIMDYQANGIYIQSQKMSTDIINIFTESPAHIVCCSNVQREGLDPSIITILLEAYSGFRKAMDHLIRLGHERIAYIHGTESPGSERNDVRLSAYTDALAEAGLPFDNEIVNIRAKREDIPAIVEEMMSLPDRPTAFLCGNDNYAIAAMYALIKIGYRVPDDVAIVGNGDIRLSKTVHPAVSTIRIPYKELGVSAAKLLISKINGEQVESITIPTSFIRRESS